MRTSLVTTDKNKISGWISLKNVPTPPNHQEMTTAELEEYTINYLYSIPLSDLIQMVRSSNRKNFIYSMADPKNADVSYEKLWLQAGYKNTFNLSCAMTDPVSTVCIRRLRKQNVQCALREGSTILEPEDLLHILSTMIAQNKIPLENGKKMYLKDQASYLKALDNLMKYYGMLDNKVRVDGNINIEIKLPEKDSIDVNFTPLTEINPEISYEDRS